MATREAQTDTDLTESTFTAGAAIEKANVTFTPLADTTYAKWLTGLTQNVTGASADPFWATDDVPQEDAANLVNTLDYSQILSSDHLPITTPSGSMKESLYLTGVGTAKAKHTHALNLELRDEDEGTESVGTSTTTSATMQDKATLPFTPATAGDYLVVAEAHVKHGSITDQVECQLTIDGTVYNKMVHRPRSTAEWHPWTCVIGAIDGETAGRLTAASHTIKVQYRSAGGVSTAEIRQVRITALRLDTFANFYYEENASRARQTTTSTAYSTKLTNAPTIANDGNHLVFASCHLDGTNGRTTFGKIDQGVSSATTLLECQYNTTRSTGNDDGSAAMIRMEDLSAGASDANSWTIAIKKNAGFGGVGCQHCTICVIELAEAAVSTRVVSIGEAFSRTKIAYAG